MGGGTGMLVGLFKVCVVDPTTVIQFSSTKGDVLVVTCDCTCAQIAVNRSRCGPPRASDHEAEGNLTAQGYVSSEPIWIALDRTSIEIFARLHRHVRDLLPGGRLKRFQGRSRPGGSDTFSIFRSDPPATVRLACCRSTSYLASERKNNTMRRQGLNQGLMNRWS